VISGSSDRTVRVWALGLPAENSRPAGHTDFVRGLAETPGSGLLVSASDDSTVRVWDPRSGRCLQTLVGHDGGVWVVAAPADGSRVLTGSEDYTLRLWDLPTGRLLRVLEGHQEKVCALALSADGTCAVSGAYDETVMVWDLSTGRPLCTLRGHVSLLTDVAITPNGRVVVSAAMDRTVRVWDVAAGHVRAIWDAHPDVVETVAICPDGRTVLSGGINDSHLRIWDLETLEQSAAVEGPFNSIEKITFGPQGRIALCAVDDTWRGSLSILDMGSRAWRQHLRGHADQVGDIALSADESLAASVSLDHTLRLWNLREGVEAAHLTLDAGLAAVAMAHDGSWIAAGSESGALHFARPVWPETEGTPIA